MERTWLVQRLNKPQGIVNPFSFGGGLKNGGLSDRAMSLLKEIFSFDYMGSAEFEFGAVANTLNKLAKSDLVAFSLNIPLSRVAPHWTDKNPEPPAGNATLYVICDKNLKKEVSSRIRLLAKRDYRLKEATHLPAVLRPAADTYAYHPQTRGWLELDNGFFFFVDEEMWKKTCQLFGISD